MGNIVRFSQIFVQFMGCNTHSYDIDERFKNFKSGIGIFSGRILQKVKNPFWFILNFSNDKIIALGIKFQYRTVGNRYRFWVLLGTSNRLSHYFGDDLGDHGQFMACNTHFCDVDVKTVKFKLSDLYILWHHFKVNEDYLYVKTISKSTPFWFILTFRNDDKSIVLGIKFQHWALGIVIDFVSLWV